MIYTYIFLNIFEKNAGIYNEKIFCIHILSYLLSISMYVSYNENKIYIIIICDMIMKTCIYIIKII